MAKAKAPKVTKSSRTKNREYLSNHKFVELALKRQHKAIGIPYDAARCQQEGWYREHSWTPAQKEGFRQWFIKTVMGRMGRTQRGAEGMFSWWDLGYGWRELNSSSSQEKP